MITVKILCGCGQKYAFDVEPYNGRMPSTIQCPICKADGTQAANEIIARSLQPQPLPSAVPPPPPPMVAPAPRPMTPAAAAGGLRIGSSTPATAAKPVAEPEAGGGQSSPASAAVAGLVKVGVRAALRGEDDDESSEKWKWWYYVLGGLFIIGYDAWMLYDTHRLKFIGGIFGGMFCIAVGIWDFKRKRPGKA